MLCLKKYEMNLIIAFILIYQVSSFPTKLNVFISNGMDTIFFEHINFKGKNIKKFLASFQIFNFISKN